MLTHIGQNYHCANCRQSFLPFNLIVVCPHCDSITLQMPGFQGILENVVKAIGKNWEEEGQFASESFEMLSTADFYIYWIGLVFDQHISSGHTIETIIQQTCNRATSTSLKGYHRELLDEAFSIAQRLDLFGPALAKKWHSNG